MKEDKMMLARNVKRIEQGLGEVATAIKEIEDKIDGEQLKEIRATLAELRRKASPVIDIGYGLAGEAVKK